ncbi:MAG: glycosyltransferase family 2 protein [bacterium]
MISVVIPVRNKELKRLNEVIDRLNHNLVGEIIIVDYHSDIPIKIEKPKTKVIRYKKPGIWNKAHAINIGFKKSKESYVMTLDADILLNPNFFEDVKPYLTPDNFIYTNFVRRINIEEISDDWDKMLSTSRKWNENYDIIGELHNAATGGVQIFPREFFINLNGLDENLVYYGGMDNITIIEAKLRGYNVIVLNETILHIDHPNLKEDNLPEEEREFSRFIREDRINLMRNLMEMGHNRNCKSWGSLKKPNDNLIKIYRNAFDEKNKNISESFELPQDTKIMIAVISNREVLPKRFVQSLFNLFHYTQNIFPNTEIHYFSSCQVNEMRNNSVLMAIERKFDYLVQLDEDHDYPQNFIIQLIGRNKDFITGCTRRRQNPYYPTQYYNFKIPLMSEENFVYSEGKDGLVKIEASGPVGMLMKVSALKELDYPYYRMDHSYYRMVLNSTEEPWTFHPVFQPMPLGGDYFFCKKVKEKGMEIWLDTSLEFPHYVRGIVRGLGEENNKEKSILEID